MRSSRQRGFSLLEAIVALAVLASVGMALFAAINQSLQMVARAEAARERESAMRNVVAWLQTVNPAQTPTGEQPLGDYLVRWDSEPVEPPREEENGYMKTGLYRVGLYDIHLRLDRDGQPFADLHVRRVGYVQVREPWEM